MSITQWFHSQAADFYDTGIQKLVPGYDKCVSSGGEYVENSSTLAVSVPINLSVKLGFVCVNGPWDSYFVDTLGSFQMLH